MNRCRWFGHKRIVRQVQFGYQENCARCGKFLGATIGAQSAEIEYHRKLREIGEWMDRVGGDRKDLEKERVRQWAQMMHYFGADGSNKRFLKRVKTKALIAIRPLFH